jgi:hypothetical protein
MLVHVHSLGAGVQSTTLYLVMREGSIEAPGVIAIFADTQEEPAAVYEHLKWLPSLEKPPILIRTAGKLGDDLLANGPGRYKGGKMRWGVAGDII